MEAAPQLINDTRSFLIVDPLHNDLVLAGRSKGNAVLCLEGLSDREIAVCLQIHYEPARRRGKALRPKLCVSNRGQMVTGGLQMGLPGNHSCDIRLRTCYSPPTLRGSNPKWKPWLT